MTAAPSTRADEAILVPLAQMASNAIETIEIVGREQAAVAALERTAVELAEGRPRDDIACLAFALHADRDDALAALGGA